MDGGIPRAIDRTKAAAANLALNLVTTDRFFHGGQRQTKEAQPDSASSFKRGNVLNITHRAAATTGVLDGASVHLVYELSQLFLTKSFKAAAVLFLLPVTV